jgi:hypothetical protein
MLGEDASLIGLNVTSGPAGHDGGDDPLGEDASLIVYGLDLGVTSGP